jgi:hypothetical protein
MNFLVGLVAALLALCISLGVWLKSEVGQVSTLKDKVEQVQDKLVIATKDLESHKMSCAITEGSLYAYQSRVEEIDHKATIINEALDESLVVVLKQTQRQTDAKEQTIKSVESSTDVVLSNSMWNSYCTVRPSDSDCTSRQSTN